MDFRACSVHKWSSWKNIHSSQKFLPRPSLKSPLHCLLLQLPLPLPSPPPLLGLLFLCCCLSRHLLPKRINIFPRTVRYFMTTQFEWGFGFIILFQTSASPPLVSSATQSTHQWWPHHLASPKLFQLTNPLLWGNFEEDKLLDISQSFSHLTFFSASSFSKIWLNTSGS